jgi:hypothetical protein
MKIYSILIMSLTLVLFYNLAVSQQNKRESESKSPDFKHKTVDFKKHSTIEPYVLIEDEFSMQVTGKEHRYLNTGISYIEYAEAAQKKRGTIDMSKKRVAYLEILKTAKLG